MKYDYLTVKQPLIDGTVIGGSFTQNNCRMGIDKLCITVDLNVYPYVALKNTIAGWSLYTNELKDILEKFMYGKSCKNVC